MIYTNYASRKGRELAHNPWVSMVFPWHAVERSCRSPARARVADREATYFASRPYGSRLGRLGQPAVIGDRVSGGTRGAVRR